MRLSALYPIELMLDHGPPISRVENMDTDVAIDWGEHNWSGRESAHLLFAGSQSASGKRKGGSKSPSTWCASLFCTSSTAANGKPSYNWSNSPTSIL